MTPFLIASEKGSRTQPLAGAGWDAILMKCVKKEFGKETSWEHYTNVHRMRALAETHPLVRAVKQHKLDKSLDNSTFDATGRALRHHQSPWDLQISLDRLGPGIAASGAKMFCGVSVHKAHKDLLSIWWQPAGNMTRDQIEIARAVFLDIAEGRHMIPDSVKKLP